MARRTKLLALGIICLAVISALVIYAFLPTTEPIETTVSKIKVGMTEKEVDAIMANWIRIPFTIRRPGWQQVAYESKQRLWSEYRDTVYVRFTGDPFVVDRTPRKSHVLSHINDSRTPWERIKDECDYLAGKLGW
jgi:hypothetical protein